jgi:hypothetical protein
LFFGGLKKKGKGKKRKKKKKPPNPQLICVIIHGNANKRPRSKVCIGLPLITYLKLTNSVYTNDQ